MSAQALLIECQSRGLRLRADGSELVIKGPLDAELKQRLREYKPELLMLLSANTADKVRAIGGTLRFERHGEALFWIAADAAEAAGVEATGRTPCLSAAEAEQIAQLPLGEMHQVIELRQAFDAALAKRPAAQDIGTTVGGIRVGRETA